MSRSRILVSVSCSVALAIVGLLLLRDCSAGRPNSQMFEALNLVEIAKDAPGERDLEHCARNPTAPNAECKILREALAAYDELFASGRDHALHEVLQSIGSTCRVAMGDPDDSTGVWNECYGAIESMVFFKSDDEDERLLRFFGDNPDLLVWILRSGSFAWVSNRPYPEKWERQLEAARREPLRPETNPFRLHKISYPIDIIEKAASLRAVNARSNSAG